MTMPGHQLDRMLADPDLLPFEPPARPLGWTGLGTLYRNYIESYPRSAYEQGVTRMAAPLSDVVLACDPNLVSEILVEKADAFGRDSATRRAFAPLIGTTSLFLAEGPDWRWQRRAIAPIFRHETLLSFVSIFVTMAERQVERWRGAQRAGPVEAAAVVPSNSLDIVDVVLLVGA